MTDRQVIPAFLRVGLYALLVVAALLSLPRVGQFTLLPMTALLDAWVIALIVTSMLRGRVEAFGLVVLIGGYLLTRLVPAIVTNSPFEDTLQAYRWVLYLIAFAFAIGRKWGPLEPLVKVTWVLLCAAFVKAALTRATLGAGERPGLLLENNFEMALFCGMVVVLYQHIRHRGWAIGLLCAITLLSGSRSGAVAFAILAVYALVRARIRNPVTRYLSVAAVPLIVLIPVWVFTDRAATSLRLDRLNFLGVFWAEVRGWDAFNWLFGTMPITPLSTRACNALAYYESLFASTGDGSCYSVILHAFVLRVSFDAGLVGLALAILVPWVAMRRGGVRFGLALALSGIAMVNGASVSGLNNPYVALPIIVAILSTSSRVAMPGRLGVELAATGRRGRWVWVQGEHQPVLSDAKRWAERPRSLMSKEPMDSSKGVV